MAHQVAGVTPPAPRDLVSSPSAWEAVGTNACPIVLCQATQCPPLHVGWGASSPVSAGGGATLPEQEAGYPLPLTTLGPREGHPGSYLYLGLWMVASRWEPKPPCSTPCRGLHKPFLLKRHSCLRPSPACSTALGVTKTVFPHRSGKCAWSSRSLPLWKAQTYWAPIGLTRSLPWLPPTTHCSTRKVAAQGT